MSNGLSQAEIDALLNGGAAAEPAPPAKAADIGGGDPGRMLSQEEIEAMLGQAGETSPSPPAAQADDNRMLSQDEIAAMLSEGLGESQSAPSAEPETEEDYSNLITGMEIDALGEIGNISMGTAATTLFSLLNRRVDITTPRVSITTMQRLSRQYPMPFVSVEVQYTQGLEGTNCLFLQEKDVKIITDLMLGGDGTNTDGDLNEMHLSCISEVMNQMVGASSTSLSQILKKPIDISPPRAQQASLSNPDLRYPYTNSNTPIICTSFNMVVEGLINSEIMQITNIEFGKEMVKTLMGMSAAAPPPPQAMPEEKSINEAAHTAGAYPDMQASPPPGMIPPDPQQPYPYPPQPYPQQPYPPQQQQPYPPQYQQPYPQQQPYPPQYQQPYPPQPYPQQPYPQQPYPPQYQQPYPLQAPQQSAAPVDVRPASFTSFGESAASGALGENMDLLMDVPLTVSVELGKSRKHIKEILDFNIGTLIVLDKMAGDMVDVVVNGKLIAQGEVVVVDDSYGCRITDIVSPSKRIIATK